MSNGHTLSNLSGTAICILVAAFSFFTGHWAWAIGFIILGVLLAAITGRQ